MSPFSSLISASALAITVALAGVVSTASTAAPLPPDKPSISKHDKGSAKASAKASTKASTKTHTSAKSTKPSAKSASKPTSKSTSKSASKSSKSAQGTKSASSGKGKSAGSHGTTSHAAAALSAPRPQQPAPSLARSSDVPHGDLSALKTAVSAARNGRVGEAMSSARELRDPVARTLVEWLAIRHAPNDLGFDNIVDFLQEHPGWPTQSTLRRRAERVLFQERGNPAKARAFFAQQPPLSGEGKVALARALAASGDTSDARDWVRSAWREDALNERFEETILSEFGSMLTRADHKARADRFSYKPDSDRALRAAARAGSDVVALTKARLAVATKASNGSKLMSAVPFTLSSDPAYLFAKSQLLRRADHPQEAARALLAGAASTEAQVDPDEWWIERRLVARELLDAGDPRTAYQVAATGVTPEADNYRAEQQFTAGWIALRFLRDPRTAAAHFARIAHGQKHPITLARAYYWQGRAAEAMGNTMQARSDYESAARFSSTYYGQLARVQLGMAPVALRQTQQVSFSDQNTFSRLEPVKAIRLLYAIGERSIPITIYYDLAWRLEDPGQLALLADLAESNGDARGALVVGKESVAEGHPLERDAFPTFGLPHYTPIGYPVDKAAIYAVARQESQFNPTTLSSAQAMGLMQVTPAAGREVSKQTGVPYNQSRLMRDQSYNVQFGAAELGELVQNYGGNYVLVFAAYNAGRGNVHKWIERYGDPRDPKVDVVDWVEMIPYSETRNYVQRVMENYQAYKVRFNIPSKLQMEADLRGGSR